MKEAADLRHAWKAYPKPYARAFSNPERLYLIHGVREILFRAA